MGSWHCLLSPEQMHTIISRFSPFFLFTIQTSKKSTSGNLLHTQILSSILTLLFVLKLAQLTHTLNCVVPSPLYQTKTMISICNNSAILSSGKAKAVSFKLCTIFCAIDFAKPSRNPHISGHSSFAK